MSSHQAFDAQQSEERSIAQLPLLRKLWPFIKPHQRYIWISLALLLIGQGSSLGITWFIGEIIDDDLLRVNFDQFQQTVLLIVSLSVVELLARAWQTWTLDLAGQNALIDLRLAVFRHLQRLSSRFYDRTPIGRLVGRVTTDIEALQEMFSSGLVTILGDFVGLFSIVGVLFLLNWQLTLVTLATVPFLLVLTLFIRTRVRRGYTELIRRRSRLNSFLHEQLSGMPLVQLFRRERDRHEKFSDESRGMQDSQLSTVSLESALSASTELIGNFTTALILWYGGGLLLDSLGGTSTGDGDGLRIALLFKFIQYMQRFLGPLNDLSLKYTVMQSAMVASERIFNLLGQEEITPEPVSPTLPKENAGRIEFDNVTFGYDPESPVLRDVSFSVAPGERIAIVGATGGGKTTLLKLITRLYDVQKGSIRIDGVDIRERPLQDLRKTVGIVPQDVFLFSGDIIDNIRLGHPEMSVEDAIRSADSLNLDQVVSRFPRGYREPVRERGGNLSSGERQLIAFARVLAVAPAILALDEATSNVDTRTEQLLQDAVHSLMENRTALIIAHRLSTVRDVDRILVVEDGRIVEEGAHDELMSRQGAYWRLVQLQYSDQASD